MHVVCIGNTNPVLLIISFRRKRMFTVDLGADVQDETTWNYLLSYQLGEFNASQQNFVLIYSTPPLDLRWLIRQRKNFMWSHLLHRLPDLLLISSFRQGHLVLLQRVRAGTTKGVGGNVGQKIWPVFVIVNSVN